MVGGKLIMGLFWAIALKNATLQLAIPSNSQGYRNQSSWVWIKINRVVFAMLVTSAITAHC
ncbi:hypothetical protein CP500_017420 [Tychonema bourrellyi FEM_GT703]|uniref:Uncharacterized protein n=2 Tax=Oscillatoriales TaxID=1150 RepID=A0A2G4EXE1_9CYAN|nr:hypothetical protein CP500_017420 [Tychonema bourrellyi FEM_GT703]